MTSLSLEPGRRPGKFCGGLLAPDARRMLSELGLGLPKSVLQDPQLLMDIYAQQGSA